MYFLKLIYIAQWLWLVKHDPWILCIYEADKTFTVKAPLTKYTVLHTVKEASVAYWQELQAFVKTKN